ncbi:hypothetical protein ART_3177 [Arthrobacter sp. PAMC 25486]|nr:hypothetical protein ART_3177 [Arthrobacter sp. PAMC 25486]
MPKERWESQRGSKDDGGTKAPSSCLVGFTLLTRQQVSAAKDMSNPAEVVSRTCHGQTWAPASL